MIWEFHYAWFTALIWVVEKIIRDRLSPLFTVEFSSLRLRGKVLGNHFEGGS